MPPFEVLIVDDSSDAAEIARRIVLRLRPGAFVRIATSGPDGLQMVRDRRPHLMIIDNRMPIMSGLQVADAVEADPSPHPVVLVVSTAKPLSQESAERVVRAEDLEELLPEWIARAEASAM